MTTWYQSSRSLPTTLAAMVPTTRRPATESLAIIKASADKMEKHNKEIADSFRNIHDIFEEILKERDKAQQEAARRAEETVDINLLAAKDEKIAPAVRPGEERRPAPPRLTAVVWRRPTPPAIGRSPRCLALSLCSRRPIGDHTFWLPHGGQRIYSRAPVGFPYCCGTPRGWLALTDGLRSPTRFILWEPVSKAEILLPCLPAVLQVFLSADPLTSSDWMVIASQKSYKCDRAQKLSFWRPGDAAWTMQLERATCRIDSAAFHQGRFYFTDKAWLLDIYDLEASPPKLLWSIYLYPVVNRQYGFGRWHGLRAVHVVACNDDLLLVVLRSVRRRTLAEVYKPNWTAEPHLELEERVTDLGEYSLFLGRGDAFALSAKEFPAVRRNCVYLVEHDKYKHEQWAIVFDLGSNASEQIPYPEEHREDGSNSTYWLAYSWFCLRGPFVKQ